ncbi:MAG: hypothetical protein IAG13_29330 [Deltaproteobacteria bacterium]|nr:hypothetical protein [Nannocystaceae bacterium]
MDRFGVSTTVLMGSLLAEACGGDDTPSSGAEETGLSGADVASGSSGAQEVELPSPCGEFGLETSMVEVAAVRRLATGDFVAAGADDDDGPLIESFAADGGLLWSKAQSGPGNYDDIVVLADGRIVTSGSIGTSTSREAHGLLTALEPDGATIVELHEEDVQNFRRVISLDGAQQLLSLAGPGELRRHDHDLQLLGPVQTGSPFVEEVIALGSGFALCADGLVRAFSADAELAWEKALDDVICTTLSSDGTHVAAASPSEVLVVDDAGAAVWTAPSSIERTERTAFFGAVLLVAGGSSLGGPIDVQGFDASGHSLWSFATGSLPLSLNGILVDWPRFYLTSSSRQSSRSTVVDCHSTPIE